MRSYPWRIENDRRPIPVHTRVNVAQPHCLSEIGTKTRHPARRKLATRRNGRHAQTRNSAAGLRCLRSLRNEASDRRRPTVLVDVHAVRDLLNLPYLEL